MQLEIDMADNEAVPSPEHHMPSMKVCRFSTRMAIRSGRDIDRSALRGSLSRLSTCLALSAAIGSL